MGSRAHTSRAWEYGRNMLKKGQEYRRLGDMLICYENNIAFHKLVHCLFLNVSWPPPQYVHFTTLAVVSRGPDKLSISMITF